ncbi:MAG: enoyl-CoA hydratase [Betaproteobacteria bacterium]|nr:MAG: enoyl-CoA hydratase [Betaproteobacteria bacterium]
MSSDIYVRRESDVAFLVLNRPAKRNAITLDMWRIMPALLSELATERTVKVLIVRGADSTAFAAGADIEEFERLNATPAAALAFEKTYAGAISALAEFPKPVIAMVQGSCVGAGCTIAVACDLRFADRSARFAVTPARLGHVYRLEDTKRLIDLIGSARAKELLFTARMIAGDEAREIGLVQHLCEAAELENAVLDSAHSIAGCSQFSVRATKQIIRMIAAGNVVETDTSAALFRNAIDGEDYREGVRAFRERRKPKFTFS